MGLDLELRKNKRCVVWRINITHNLTAMAKAAGLYNCMWNPHTYISLLTKDRLGNWVILASKMIKIIEEGIDEMVKNRGRFLAMNPKNGWGSYDNLLSVAEKYLAACIENPNASIHSHG